VEDFTRNWADKPFILTEPVKEWPAYQQWSTAELLLRYKNTPFRAEAVDWPLERYVAYMNHSNDESPLYLFDCRFAEKMGFTWAEIMRTQRIGPLIVSAKTCSPFSETNVQTVDG